MTAPEIEKTTATVHKVASTLGIDRDDVRGILLWYGARHAGDAFRELLAQP